MSPQPVAAPRGPRPPYDWRRFWYPASSAPRLQDGGFLVDPDGEWGRYTNPDVLPLEQLEDAPCLVLLGEPGLGKSTVLSLEQARARARAQGTTDLVLSRNLRSVTSDQKLLRDVFDTPEFRAWAGGGQRLWLYLDSLDEAFDYAAGLHAVLADELLRHREGAARLRLRVACRAADWPPPLEQALGELFGSDGVSLRMLAPLRRRDAADAAQAEGLDPDAFLDEVERRGVVPLAARPITLRFLLRRAGHISGDRAALYHEGCESLCTEQNPDRRAARQLGVLAPPQRLIVASRVAAAIVLGRRIGVWAGPEQDAPTSAIMDHELFGEEETDEHAVHVTREELQEVFCTGLFTSHLPEFAQLAHRTYGEFLAASFLARRHVPTWQIIDLLTGATNDARATQPSTRPRIVQELRDLAAWVGTLVPEVRTSLLHVDPDVLLRADLSAAPASFRHDLVATFLALYESGERVGVDFSTRSALFQLNHPGLADQVRPVLQDRARRDSTRILATALAEATETQALEPEILALALDGDESHEVRRAAARAIWRIGSSQARAVLWPLTSAGEAEDPREELKGYALLATWPEHAPDAERFVVLTPPRARFFSGAYATFLSTFAAQRLRDKDLVPGLAWVASSLTAAPTLTPEQNLSDEVVLRAWREVGRPEVLAALVPVALKRIRTMHQLVSDDRAEAFARSVAQDTTRRRQLLAGLLPHITDADTLEVSSGKTPLVFGEDVPWLVGRYQTTTDLEVRRVIARLIGWVCDIEQSEQTETIYPLLEADPFLADWFPLEVPITSPAGERWRQQNTGLRAADGSRDQPRADIALLDNVLGRAASERSDTLWPTVLDALQRDTGGRRIGSDVAADVRTWIGWKAADPTQRRRIVDAALAYLRAVDPQVRGWIGTSQVPGAAFNGYRALWLVNGEQPGDLDGLSSLEWARWGPTVLAAAFSADGDAGATVTSLVAGAFRAAPDAMFDAVRALVESEDAEPYGVRSLWKVESAWNDQLSMLLSKLVASRRYSGRSTRMLLQALLDRAAPDAVALATELVTADESGTTDRERAIEAALALLVYQPAAGWPAIWSRVQTDGSFGREVFEAMASTAGLPEESIDARLEPEQVVDLYLWLTRVYGEDEDERIDALRMTPSARLRTWRDTMLRRLAGRGTPEVVAALGEIMAALPARPWLREIQREAEDQVRQRGWQPLPIETILGLGLRDRARSRSADEAVPDAARILATELNDRVRQQAQRAGVPLPIPDRMLRALEEVLTFALKWRETFAQSKPWTVGDREDAFQSRLRDFFQARLARLEDVHREMRVGAGRVDLLVFGVPLELKVRELTSTWQAAAREHADQVAEYAVSRGHGAGILLLLDEAQRPPRHPHDGPLDEQAVILEVPNASGRVDTIVAGIVIPAFPSIPSRLRPA